MMDFTRPKWSCQCSYTVVEDAISSHMPADQSVKNCNMDLRRRMLHRKQVIKAYMAEHQTEFETCNASRMDLSTPKSDSQKALHRGRHPLQSSTPSKEEGENLVVNNKLKFNSCRFESSITGDQTVRFTRSSSFRSVSSGYWESGPDKDITESCSSSRDSNGSSMDSTHLHDSITEASSSSSSSSLTSSASIFSSSRRRTPNVKNFLPWKSFFHHLVIRAPRWQRVGCKADFNSDGGMQRLRGSLMNHRNMGKIAPRSEDGKRRSIVGFEDSAKSSREGGGERKGVAEFENGGKSKSGGRIEDCESKENVEDGKGYVGLKGTENEKWCLEEEKNLKTTKKKKKQQQQKKKKKGRCVLPKEQTVESNCKQKQQPKGGGESNRRIYARTMDEANGGLVKLEKDHEGNPACELQSHKITLPRKPWPSSHGHFVTKKQVSIMGSHHQYHLHGIAHHLMSFPFSAQSLPIPSRKDHAPPQPTSHYGSLSTMHELHCSLQSAIAHCKQSNTEHL